MNATKLQIKPEILEVLKINSKARTRLCYEFDVHMNTINRWIESNDLKLTTKMSLTAISDELNVKQSEILINA